MQSIYDDGIGNLDEYKGDEADTVSEVKKAQNRRNPQKVIDLANKLRTDGISKTFHRRKCTEYVRWSSERRKHLFVHSTDGDIPNGKAIFN